ncbi:MAG: hypothetical protein II050_07185, partial [Bacteroidaceae bacterium]|nr:hypothetical protein [Bacteroidaceae bacterium]
IEVRERVFVYSDARTGCRGLPAGCSGTGLLLLSGGLDSPVAGYRMMRRGMKVQCVYFHSYPYTSIEAQQKVEELAAKLSLFGLNTYLNIIPFTDVQMKKPFLGFFVSWAVEKCRKTSPRRNNCT